MGVIIVLSLVILGCLIVIELCKDAPSKDIPASNWNNQELYTQDVLNGVSHEQRMRNLRNGKYYLPDEPDDNIPNNTSGKNTSKSTQTIDNISVLLIIGMVSCTGLGIFAVVGLLITVNNHLLILGMAVLFFAIAYVLYRLNIRMRNAWKNK